MSLLDLSPFFSGDDFNTEITYTDYGQSHPNSKSVTFYCIWENAVADKNGKFSPWPTAVWDVANTPDIQRGAQVRKGGIDYTVQEVMTDGTGLVNVTFEKQ